MTEVDGTIALALRRIQALEHAVREFINTGRHQVTLLSSRDTWNQICSSLDVIGDTVLSLEDYLSSPYPESVGLKYIYTYGILQSLFLQQDAVRDLSEAFSIPHTLSRTLEKIRDIRNAAIGHPTNQRIKKATHYNYISRISLQKSCFTLMRSSAESDTQFVDVQVTTIIAEQLAEIEVALTSVASKLEETDRMHREKFGGKMITDIFHSSSSYFFEKVAEGIHSTSGDYRSFGLSMLGAIEKMYAEFEAALQERRELNDYTRHDLDEYKHALRVLKEYLSGNPKGLGENDARIYLFYAREQHSHFVQIAAEVDDEYKKT